ncbi:MAG: hypothetical protein CSB44_08240 [Gammaproteobacteria bacterium]|nr:MAG: hypothetical protein CSB44_08240 [Gammaproteobacteria bacterium]
MQHLSEHSNSAGNDDAGTENPDSTSEPESSDKPVHAPAHGSAAERAVIDVGVIIAGPFDPRMLRLARLGQARLAETLEAWFPRFAWRFELLLRRDIDPRHLTESSQLLTLAAEEREARHWDAVVMLVEQDLVPHYRSYALAALSRPLDAALVSTARLAGEGIVDHGIGHNAMDNTDTTTFGSCDTATAETTIIDRIATLELHAIAHLGGLAGARERHRLLFRPDSLADLDVMEHLEDAEREELDRAFGEIADTRLEEMPAETSATRSNVQFVARAAMINRSELIDAVLAARPWEFPLRLSRLSTAAVSTVVVLMMTAEAWDLALSQYRTTLLLLALITLGTTTAFVIHRQQLLLGRQRELREQLVVSQLSAVLIVLAGLAITWVLMLLLVLAGSMLLYSDALIADWAASSRLSAADVGIGHSVTMALFCASLGLLIGSLGASFEDQFHFRHVIYVDEEL